jgi:hypothetical protein
MDQLLKILKYIPENSLKRLRVLVLLATSIVLIMSTIVISKIVIEKRTIIPSSVDSFYLPSPKTLNLISLGNQRMLADILWIKTLMYFGQEMMGNSRQIWLTSYLDALLYLDPHFEKAYEWAGAATIYSGRIIDSSSILSSVKYYEMGLKQFPNNWKMAASLGFNYAYELKPKDEKLASSYRKKAIKLFLKAAKSPQAPSYIKSFALNQMDKEGFRIMAIKYLKDAYATARDDSEKKILEKKMKKLLGSKDAALWKKWRKQYEEGYEQDLPYGSFELFILLGKKDSLFKEK